MSTIFMGDLSSNYADFAEKKRVNFKGLGGVGKTTLTKPDTKTQVGIGAGLGGGVGLLSQTLRKKAGWKSKVAGALIGAGLGGGGTYAATRNKGIFAKDGDGRSDRGKKRK